MPRSSGKNNAPVGQQRLKDSPKNIETMRASDSRFRAVFENAAVGIARMGLDGRWLEVNQRLCDIVCYDRSDLMSKTFAEITHPDDLAEDTRQVQRLLAGEIETYLIEKRYYRKNGSLVWVNLTVSLVRNPDGSPDYFIAIVEDISPRRLAEEKLRESEERLRLASEAAGLGVFEWNVDTDFAVWENERMYKIFGHAPDDGTLSKAQLVERYVHPDDVATLEQALTDGAKSGPSFQADYRIRRKDGAMRWLSLSARYEQSHDGLPVRMIGVLGDITERRRVEDTLRASEEQFRILADTAPVMIWMSGTDKLCSFFNQPWLDFTGRTMEQELGNGWEEGIYWDDHDRCLGTYGTSFEAREPFEMEYRLRRFDGEYRWVLDHGVPRFSSNGDFLGYIGSCIDITERKEIEQALRESQERLAGIVSSAMDAIITVDEHQRVVLFNRAAERMFGCTAHDAIGLPLDRFIPERFRSTRAENLWRFGETGGPSRGSPSALRSDGSEFPIDASISNVRVAGKTLYTVFLRDITEQKRAEAEREQLAREQVARAAAEAASRSKDEFLAMVSHELRSPLSAIIGYSHLLRSGLADRERINKATAVIERNAKMQGLIIDDLLDSARIVTGKLRIEPILVDLVPVLESALDTVRPAAEAKGVALIADFGMQPEEVIGDPARLQQVVWNLLTNAIKFTSEGGRIELRMEDDSDHVRITVRDTGRGIDPGFLPLVFGRFRQADSSSVRRVGGLGLGLSLAKHLVELHSGTITAASEGVGRGSTFTVTLPRRRPEFIERPPAAAGSR